MIRTLFEHEWKRLRRAADFRRNLSAKIAWGFLIGLITLEVLVFGIMMGFILREECPGQDPITVFNSFLLYYFLTDLLMRFMWQKLQTLSARPYLLIPVPRDSVVLYVLLRTSTTVFNILPLFMFIPVSMSVVGATAGVGSAFAWMIVILMGISINCLLAAVLKTLMLERPVFSATFFVSIALIVGLGWTKSLPVSQVSSVIFNAPTHQPFWILIPALLLFFLFRQATRVFSGLVQYGSSVTAEQQRKQGVEIQALDRFGDIGRLIMLDLRMIWRNKRAKPAIIIGALMVFYGTLMLRDSEKTSSLFLLFIGLFTTGTMMITYGSYTFSWESTSFGMYTTRPLPWIRFLLAKYVLMASMTLVSFAISTFYGFLYGWHIFMHFGIAALFIIGVAAPVMLWFGTLARVRFDLNASAFSAQGKTGAHYGIVFVLLILLASVYFSGYFVWGTQAGLGAVATVGLVGIAGHRWILGFIARAAERNKYRMMEGFRQH